MNAHISIRVEFQIGDSIVKVKQKPMQLDVDYVIFNFNGIELHISKDCDIDYVKQQLDKKFVETVTKVVVS